MRRAKQWYGSAYNITLCAFQLVFGRLYTYFPIKTVFLSAMFAFEVGSVVCALAPTSVAFIAGRAVAGLGAAGLSSGGYVMLLVALPPEKAPTYIGALGMICASCFFFPLCILLLPSHFGLG